MNKLLSRLLDKRGIKKVEDLSSVPPIPGLPSEKQEFESWQKILDVDEITVDKIKEFLSHHIGIIEAKFKDINLDNDKKSQLIPYFTCYKVILDLINSPSPERENLEKYLNQLLQS